MNGTVLKTYSGLGSYGIPAFLGEWQNDTVEAIAKCRMGDRDSYPGQYVSQLAEEGFILREELTAAVALYLCQKRWQQGQYPWSAGLDEVIALAPREGFEEALAVLVSQFDELSNRYPADDWYQRQLIHAVSTAKDLPPSLLGRLRQWFCKNDDADFVLFQLLYLNHASASDERERILQSLCMKGRRLLRHVGENKAIITSLRHMLRNHFGFSFKKYGTEEEAEERRRFEEVEAKANRWLTSQNAFSPL